MPKVSNKINYETDYVSFYKFVCKDNDIKFTYVGHTTNFASRKSCHKHDCNTINRKNYNYKLYIFMREHGGFENWNMIEIESRLVKDKRDAERIEQELLEQQDFKLNMIKAYITKNEIQKQQSNYRVENKEDLRAKREIYSRNNRKELLEKSRKYYAENKEIRTEKARIFYAENKEKEAIRHVKYYTENQESIKLRRVENREKTAERNKIYRAKNKEKEAERHAKYYAENKEKVKIYLDKNKEIIAEKNKIYCAKNKEKIAEQKRICYIKQKALKEAQLNPETNADI